jgi:epoxyqueuosine reductase
MGGRLGADDVKSQARAAGFDLCGIAAADAYPELLHLRAWIERGYAGDMHYMERTADRRADVRSVLPSARSVISLATVYNTDRPYSVELAEDRARIARYAWGDDYHEVIGRRLDRLVESIRCVAGGRFEARAYVDTGPVQERAYAQRAGLGWIGKNACVINAELGSWLFLSEIICNLDLEPDAPALDQCGTCALCLEACPTGALVEPGVLDSTKCLSYLTIEVREAIPEAHRTDLGSHVFGCDICQEVCPFNAGTRPDISGDPAWQPRPTFDGSTLVALWRRRDDELRAAMKGTATTRAGVKRLRRNLAVALGNTRNPAVVDRPSDSRSLDDPLVVEHVEWGRRKLA